MSKHSQALINLVGPIASAAISPLVTGPLLLLLTTAPPHIQEPVLRQLAKLPPQVTVSRITSVLKWLFAIGLADHFNAWLNSLATNGWSLRSDQHRWIWPTEIAVVTGGCSGIGEVVVNGLVKKGVKVAILDVQPLPKRLEHGTPMSSFTLFYAVLISSSKHLLLPLRHHRSRCRHQSRG